MSGGDKVLQERLGTWEVSEQASGACGGGEVCQSEKLRQSCTKWKKVHRRNASMVLIHTLRYSSVLFEALLTRFGFLHMNMYLVLSFPPISSAPSHALDSGSSDLSKWQSV